jgi:hypothetical protein
MGSRRVLVVGPQSTVGHFQDLSPIDLPTFWGNEPLYEPTAAPDSHRMIPNPTRPLLQVFQACLRRLDDQSMIAVRERFIALGEHPDVIAVIEHDVMRRENERHPIRMTARDDTAPSADKPGDRSAPGIATVSESSENCV